MEDDTDYGTEDWYEDGHEDDDGYCVTGCVVPGKTIEAWSELHRYIK